MKTRMTVEKIDWNSIVRNGHGAVACLLSQQPEGTRGQVVSRGKQGEELITVAIEPATKRKPLRFVMTVPLVDLSYVAPLTEPSSLGDAPKETP